MKNRDYTDEGIDFLIKTTAIGVGVAVVAPILIKTGELIQDGWNRLFSSDEKETRGKKAA